MHILVYHVPYLFRQHGCLIAYANQGFESSHKYDSLIIDRSVSRGTTKSPQSDGNIYDDLIGNRTNLKGECWNNWCKLYNILQVYLYHLRILYMACTVDNALWNRLPRRVSSKEREYYKRINESLKNNIEVSTTYDLNEINNIEEEDLDLLLDLDLLNNVHVSDEDNIQTYLSSPIFIHENVDTAHNEENIEIQNGDNINDLFNAIDNPNSFDLFHNSMVNSQFNFDQ